MQFCHSNFFFVAGLSWTIKIITLKQVIHGNLLIPSVKIQPKNLQTNVWLDSWKGMRLFSCILV